MEHDKPMHWESGFLRYNQDTNTVAFLLAENFGRYISPKIDHNKWYFVIQCAWFINDLRLYIMLLGLTEILEGKLSEAEKEFEVTANKDTITRMSFARSPPATQVLKKYYI